MGAVITLTTDFGTSDAYVAAMKGRILGLAPGCRLVDITHHVPPGNVMRGALAVRDAALYFPEGTIHLVVVDPGVGTARRAMAVQTERLAAVGPDNGVLSLLWSRSERARLVELDPAAVAPGPVSATFHGRDLFAPAAALLAAGLAIQRLGPPLSDPLRMQLPEPRWASGGACLVGEVLYADRFGNLITNIRADQLPGLPEDLIVEIGDRQLHGLVRSYGQGRSGLVALLGSTGLLEVAVRDGSAKAALGVGYGARVKVRAADGPGDSR